MNFEEDSFVQVVAPNGDYRYGYIKATDEDGWHLTICLHDEADSKLAFEAKADWNNDQAPIGWQYGLTVHEVLVLTLLSKDPRTWWIAGQLNLQQTTIRGYLRTLRLKLRVENRAQLVMVARAIVKSMPSSSTNRD